MHEPDPTEPHRLDWLRESRSVAGFFSSRRSSSFRSPSSSEYGPDNIPDFTSAAALTAKKRKSLVEPVIGGSYLISFFLQNSSLTSFSFAPPKEDSEAPQYDEHGSTNPSLKSVPWRRGEEASSARRIGLDLEEQQRRSIVVFESSWFAGVVASTLGYPSKERDIREKGWEEGEKEEGSKQ